ncbi:microtubule-associated protein 4 isoform X2 [Drosophila busckii]|nr:microtubule-associated protein 4 isoform X2 [Drosophila busckii]
MPTNRSNYFNTPAAAAAAATATRATRATNNRVGYVQAGRLTRGYMCWRHMRFQHMREDDQHEQQLQRKSGIPTLVTNSASQRSIGNGKVRQMFDGRRRGVGIDRSHPLQPIVETRAQATHVMNKAYSTMNLRDKSLASDNNNNNSSCKYNARTTTNPLKPVVTRKTPPITNRTETNSQRPVAKAAPMRTKTMMTLKTTASSTTTETATRNTAAVARTTAAATTRATPSRTPTPTTSRGVTPPRTPTSPTSATRTTPFWNSSPKVSTSPTPPPKISTRRTTPPRTATSKAPTPPPRTPTAKTPTTPVTARLAGGRAAVVQPTTKTRQANQIVSPVSKIQMICQSEVQPAENFFFRKLLQSIMQPPAGTSSCRHCGRHFTTDRLAKHEEVCVRIMKTKRRIFDASKQRTKGTEQEKFNKNTTQQARQKPALSRVQSVYSSAAQQQGLSTGVKKSNWRKQHEEFIEAIRSAKQVQAHLKRGGKLSDLPPPPPSENPDYIQCQYCGRRFNPQAAERHIPRCATMIHNKPRRSGAQGPQKKRY